LVKTHQRKRGRGGTGPVLRLVFRLEGRKKKINCTKKKKNHRNRAKGRCQNYLRGGLKNSYEKDLGESTRETKKKKKMVNQKKNGKGGRTCIGGDRNDGRPHVNARAQAKGTHTMVGGSTKEKKGYYGRKKNSNPKQFLEGKPENEKRNH